MVDHCESASQKKNKKLKILLPKLKQVTSKQLDVIVFEYFEMCKT